MFTYLGFCRIVSFHLFLFSFLGCYNTLIDGRLIPDKTKINYCPFPRGQVFSLGIRLPRSLNSFKGEIILFLSVFSAQDDFGIWVSSTSQIMWLHSPTKKRQMLMCLKPSTNKQQLFSFRSLKNYHVLAFWPFIPQYQSSSQVCLFPQTQTWLIESGVFSCPCQLVLIERIEEKWSKLPFRSGYWGPLIDVRFVKPRTRPYFLYPLLRNNGFDSGVKFKSVSFAVVTWKSNKLNS